MKKELRIIGLGGTNGAGKDTVGKILAEQYNYWFFPFTDLFRQECRARGLSVTRENQRTISAEWRRESGLAVLVDRTMEQFKNVGGFDKYNGVVMSSLRNPYEADRIHELGGTVVWVDADPKTRYDRVQKNAAARGRTMEDMVSFADFMQHELDEMHPPEGADEAALNGAAVKERTDIFISNNTPNVYNLIKETAQKLDLK